MGNKPTFEVNCHVKGQGPDTLISFDHLNLTTREVNKFWREFKRMDKNNTGEISLSQFHAHYGFEETAFTKLVFKTMDRDRDGQLNFEEFVICVWDFLSDELSHFAFRLFDKNKSHFLSRSEVIEMTRYVYGRNHGSNHTIDSTIDRMAMDSNGNVSFSEFRDQCKKNQSILWPAFVVQGTLRRTIIGEHYWRDVEYKRMRNMPGMSVWDVLGRTEQEVSDAEITLHFDDDM